MKDETLNKKINGHKNFPKIKSAPGNLSQRKLVDLLFN